MSLTSKEAAESVAQAEEAGRRSAEVHFYRKASPHLILWGSIWVLGFTQNDLFPRYEDWGWLLLIAAGVIGGAIIARRSAVLDRGRFAWRLFAAAAIAAFFVFATYAIMSPVSGAAMVVFPALIVGTLHCAIGLWSKSRFLISGFVVLAASLCGFFFLHEHLLLWMAFVGGGAMILAGLWCRTI